MCAPTNLKRETQFVIRVGNRQIRVIDESGEDYLYPEGLFVPVKLPHAVEQAVRRATAWSAPNQGRLDRLELLRLKQKTRPYFILGLRAQYEESCQAERARSGERIAVRRCRLGEQQEL